MMSCARRELDIRHLPPDNSKTGNTGTVEDEAATVSFDGHRAQQDGVKKNTLQAAEPHLNLCRKKACAYKLVVASTTRFLVLQRVAAIAVVATRMPASQANLFENNCELTAIRMVDVAHV